MFVVTVWFEVLPEHRATFLELMRDNARVSLERETGCRQFDVCIDPQSPTAVFLYELYVDDAAFQAHLSSSHFQAFDEATRGLISEKNVRLWQRI